MLKITSYHLFLCPFQHAMLRAGACTTQRCPEHVNSRLRMLFFIRTLNYFRRVRGISKTLKKKGWQDSCFIESNGVLFLASRKRTVPSFFVLLCTSTCTRLLCTACILPVLPEPREFQTAPLGHGVPADL